PGEGPEQPRMLRRPGARPAPVHAEHRSHGFRRSSAVSAPRPEAEFEVRSQGTAGVTRELRAVPDEGLLIGRAGSCRLLLSHSGVAPVHARLRVLGSVGVLEDLRSPSGTRVNGRALRPGAPSPVRSGDAVALGEAELAVRLHLPASPAGVRRGLAGGTSGL